MSTLPIPFSLHDGITSYPLELIIQLPARKTQYQGINCSILFPKNYTKTPFRMNQVRSNDLALLLMTYDTELHNLEIDIFYVYSAFATVQSILLPGERLKGLGKYMLCRVLRWLIQHCAWFSEKATATLTASGNQCYDMSPYQFSFEDCMAILRSYPMSLFYMIRESDLFTKLQARITIEPFDTYDELVDTYPDIDRVLIDLIQENNNPDVLILLQELLCRIRTNQQLMERNYKPYGFDIIQDRGEEAKMKGSVTKILAACESFSYGALLRKARKNSRQKTQKNSRKRSKKSAQKRF